MHVGRLRDGLINMDAPHPFNAGPDGSRTPVEECKSVRSPRGPHARFREATPPSLMYSTCIYPVPGNWQADPGNWQADPRIVVSDNVSAGRRGFPGAAL
ncbi:hypothetical protein STTU_p0021 (plasmid) [Streptomyces sp. Tu6071]|nr:hypothetical protein STTU_p0021 [Streptomyces sp. Tu6071]